MNAINIGPLVLAYDRLVILISLALFLALAEWIARRREGPRFSIWAWNAVTAGLVAARLGYVFTHLSIYLQDPLNIFYVWQGGFSSWWGLLGGFLYSIWFFRRQPRQLASALLPALAGLALGLGLWYGPQRTAAEFSLPAVELRDLEGNPVNLNQFSGKPLVVNAWATWCPPCRRELPTLVQAANDYPDVAFVFVDEGESAATVTSYLLQRHLQPQYVWPHSYHHASARSTSSWIPNHFLF